MYSIKEGCVRLATVEILTRKLAMVAVLCGLLQYGEGKCIF